MKNQVGALYIVRSPVARRITDKHGTPPFDLSYSVQHLLLDGYFDL